MSRPHTPLILSCILLVILLICGYMWFFFAHGSTSFPQPEPETTSATIQACTAAEDKELDVVEPQKEQADTINTEMNQYRLDHINSIVDKWHDDPTGKAAYDQQLQVWGDQYEALMEPVRAVQNKYNCVYKP